jgi:hypothetical protein
MKRRTLNLIAATALAVAMMLPTSATASPAGRKAHPTPSPQQAHLELRNAINALQAAREHLNEASHDFGGHRADALRAINEAMRQLQLCMKYDQ